MAVPRPGRRDRIYESGVFVPPIRERERLHVDRAHQAKVRRKEIERRRGFAALVVIPVLLMLGSIYLHTVSGSLGERVAGLEERVARAEADGQKLNVQVAELSAPGRIREKARDLGLSEPGGEDMRVDGGNGEDGKAYAGEKQREENP
ncbi:MAG TPA: hypothetical protein VFJ72_15155 [Rubrobacteraceae bacterium]|nr:hypothetical protein [Rubrobacteraceae bacterium]